MKTLSKHLLLLTLLLVYAGCYHSAIVKKDNVSSAEQNQKTVFLFYTPSEATILPDNDSLSVTRQRIAQMERWLSQSCGGFSRWEVVGGWIDPSTNKDRRLSGYFYWVSCSALSADRIAEKIKGPFSEKEAYVLELPILEYAN